MPHANGEQPPVHNGHANGVKNRFDADLAGPINRLNGHNRISDLLMPAGAVGFSLGHGGLEPLFAEKARAYSIPHGKENPDFTSPWGWLQFPHPIEVNTGKLRRFCRQESAPKPLETASIHQQRGGIGRQSRHDARRPPKESSAEPKCMLGSTSAIIALDGKAKVRGQFSTRANGLATMAFVLFFVPSPPPAIAARWGFLLPVHEGTASGLGRLLFQIESAISDGVFPTPFLKEFRHATSTLA